MLFSLPRQSLETVDNGKPFAQAKGDVEASVGLLRYYAGWADKIEGRTIPTEGQVFGYTRVEPVGVVGIVSIETILLILQVEDGGSLHVECMLRGEFH